MGFTIHAQEFFINIARYNPLPVGVKNVQRVEGENEWQDQDQDRKM